jgi:4-amino-4-deoxy-L-arabinose transferase-like glycosyltransferase
MHRDPVSKAKKRCIKKPASFSDGHIVKLPRRSPRFLLATILIVAFCLRVGVLLLRSLHSARFLDVDSHGYLRLSRNLDAFVSKSDPLFSLGLNRTPVYPVYLFATHHITDSQLVGPMLLQVLVGVGVVYVTYRLGLSLFSQPVGLCAAAILAIDPLSILYSSVVLTEALFTLFLTASVLMFWRPSGNNWRRGLAAGVLLGLATLTRPVSFYLAVPLAVAYLILERNSLRKAALVTVCFLVGFGVLSGGWIIRNYQTTGLTAISSVQGINLLYYRAAGALVESEHISLSAARARLRRQLDRKLPPNANPGQIAQAEQTLGITVIREHLTGYSKEVLAGGARLMFGDAHSQLRTVTGVSVSRLPVAYSLAYLFGLYLLSAFGLWLAWRRQCLRSCVFPIMAIAYTIIVSSGEEAYSRFRMPMMPFLALIAAVGATTLLGRIKRDSDQDASTGAEEHPSLTAQ